MDHAQRPDDSTPIGTEVHANFRKYDGTEHWQEDYRLLGVDEFGVWLGMAAGTTFARPGMSVEASTATVRLIPHTPRWAACFNAPDENRPTQAHYYIDITTPAVWERTDEGFRVTMVDVDLDVVERFNGEVFIDDEDEFEDHQKKFGYPSELIAATRQAADSLYQAVRARQAPFDGTGDAWLAKIDW